MINNEIKNKNNMIDKLKKEREKLNSEIKNMNKKNEESIQDILVNNNKRINHLR